jgi:tripartite-type tricarboxylate transporter receptor subunit TctC
VAESGYPGFEALMWYGVVARSAAPKNAIDRLGAELLRTLQPAEVKDAFARLGLSTAPMGPAEFDAFIRSEIQSNGKIIKSIGLKAE